MQRLLSAVALAMTIGTAAIAQDAPPPPPPGGQPTPEMGPGTTPPPPPHGGPAHHEPIPAKTGFEVRMGDDTGLKVDCGDQRLAECITAAQPLIDRVAPPAE